MQGLAYAVTGRAPRSFSCTLTCHLGYWLRVMPQLVGLRVVALDFRGHGLSEHPGSYRFADYEQDLFALLDEFGLESVAVAGHSLGGYVALSAASRSDRIARVLAIDVKSDWTEQDQLLADRARDATQRVETDGEAILARLARSVAPVGLDEDELDALAERSIEQVIDGWRFRWDRRVLASEPVDAFPFLGRVCCPVHVAAGSRSDVMHPDQARRFADAIPGGITRTRRECRPPRRARGRGSRGLPGTGADLGRLISARGRARRVREWGAEIPVAGAHTVRVRRQAAQAAVRQAGTRAPPSTPVLPLGVSVDRLGCGCSER